jgi:predicted dehydrogenase
MSTGFTQAVPFFIKLGETLYLKPDIVSVNTHTATHVENVVTAMESGAYVFVVKPLAATVEEAELYFTPPSQQLDRV